MKAPDPRRNLILVFLALVVGACAEADPDTTSVGAAAPGDGSHAALVDFFGEWRSFERPAFDGEVPDYTTPSMERRASDLPEWMAQLGAFDIDDWSTAEQVDWHILRAEMNGLSFDHAVRRPWARDPAYYVPIYTPPTDVTVHD